MNFPIPPWLFFLQNNRRILLFFFCLALLFHFDKVLLGPYAPVRIHDSFDSEMIRYQSMARWIKEVGVFFWLPDLGGGQPAYAHQFGPTYLLVLLSTVFPPWVIYHGVVILLMTLAGYGMYLFLIRILKVPFNIAFSFGIFFAFTSQVSGHPLIHLVFTYVLPLIFVWLHDSTGDKIQKFDFISRAIGLVLLCWVSYPVLTTPIYPLFHLLLILSLTWPNLARMKQWMKQYLIFWTGYFFFILPTLYSILDYLKLSQRGSTAVATESPLVWTDLAQDFFTQTVQSIIIDTSASSFVFLLMLGSVALLRGDRKLWKTFLPLVALFLCAGFFNSKMHLILKGSPLGLLDVHQLSWVLPIMLILHSAQSAESFLTGEPKTRRGFYVLILLGSIVLLLRDYPSPLWKGLNVLLPAMVLLGSQALHSESFSPGRGKTNIVWPRPWMMAVLLMGVFLALKSIRLTDGGERTPYNRYFQSHPVLLNLARENGGASPFRAGFVGIPDAMAGNSGLETVGVRGPLFNGPYKEYFEKLVAPQLKDAQQTEEFFQYKYNLLLQQGPQSHPEHKFRREPKAGDWNISLLLAANVKYLVTDRVIQGMNKFSLAVTQDTGSEEIEAIAGAKSFWNLANKAVSFFDIFNAGPIGRRRRPEPLIIYELKNPLGRAYLASRLN
ncbi:MAG: hypothetical protein COV67_12615, partial [Nitrospinae bacterium CG11_big_fil_rev_8_21_14_0_20_56_8]